MKWFLSAIVFLILFFLPLEASALESSTFEPFPSRSVCPVDDDRFKALCNINPENLSQNLGNLFTILLTVAVIASILFLIWGAIKWIRSGGDKAGIDSARNTILASLVGLFIALLAFFIVNAVMYIFFGQQSATIPIPKLYKTCRDAQPSCSSGQPTCENDRWICK